MRSRALSLAAVLAALLGMTSVVLIANPVAAWFDGAAPAVASAPVAPEKKVKDLTIESMSPSDGTYGTGIVIRVRFNREVPEAVRDAALSHVTITTSKSIGKAGWAWVDDRNAVYRPKEFWPAGTKVAVDTYKTMDVIPTTRSYDLRWVADAQRDFRIGRSQVIKVDSATHMAKVVRNGKTIRTMPIALGKPGWETRSGIKVLMESYRVKEMTGESINAEEDYTLDVPYAIRMTNSGEFIHAAPWAAGNLGRVNGSHGCTNLSMSDASWLFSNHLYGDPVITKGTGRPMETYNGAGGVWNVSWSKWVKGDAS
ncbi:MAG: L,D-transpeptidase [Candidatus Nanopelagicales bacterium]